MTPPERSHTDFSATHWSVVLKARTPDPASSNEALGELCRSYWPPLYAFVRRKGHPPHDAQDLTQEFFARLLRREWLEGVSPEKGKFRSFLLASMENFLANEWRRSQAQKRGGGAAHLSLEAQEAEGTYGQIPSSTESPEAFFEKGWAIQLLDLVLRRLHAEYENAGKGELFGALKVFLTGEDAEMGYAGIAATFSMSPEAVRMAVSRMRRRYGELLTSELARTVSDPSEIREELKALLGALGR